MSQKPLNLTPQQLALLKALKQRNGLSAHPVSPITARDDHAAIPLSFAQEWMWLLEQMAAPAYNNPLTLQLSGQLDIVGLEHSLNQIIQRHEILRTTFVQKDQVVQVVAPHSAYALPMIDLSHVTASDQPQAAIDVVRQATVQVFDLSQAPPFRIVLLRLSETTHWLHWTLHHIATDDTSFSIIVKELADRYAAYLDHDATPLAALPFQYGDYACWQRHQPEDFAQHLNYWREQLAHPPLPLSWPARGSTSTTATKALASNRQPFSLSPTLTQALIACSQQAQTTLFTTVLAALNVLLYRYTQQADLIVGVPVSLRQRRDLQNLIGVFINTLLIRTQLQADRAFQTLLKQIHQSVIDARSHQELPYHKLVATLQSDNQHDSRVSLQVILDFQQAELPEIKLSQLSLSPIEIDLNLDPNISTADLTLHITQSAGQLTGYFEYNAELFDAETIQRMAAHFQVLLTGIVANPTQPIAELPLLSESERHQLLVEWNDTQTEYPPDQCVHQLFEAQVERCPEAIAVVFEDQQLTYGALNMRANQLAHDLQSRGVGPEVLVGLCVERSLEMLVGVLGVLKAGGAYLPLDPNYPSERLAFMLSDAPITVLVGQTACLERLPQHGFPTVCLTPNGDEIAPPQAPNPVIDLTPSNLAYVIYTSGSTGKPKGVMVQHDSLVNLVQSVISDGQLSPTDRLLQFASISFDVAAEEIYACLAAGGTLVLRTDAMLSSVAQFLQTVGDRHISVMDLPTAYWQQIVVELAQGQVALPGSLRLLLIGGERVSPASVKLWQTQVRDYPQLINAYGPTEATVSATAFRVSPTRLMTNAVPIGQPIANVQTYVLDPHLQPVPIGVAGELYIGGRGVARGYLNRAELTAARFIADPFRAVPEARLYKTGDCVRYLPDGNLEFLGRIDDQVKIRGFRVELGEIESALVQHPQISEVVVILREDQPGDSRLVAYVVAASAAVPSGSDLRQYLKQQLPDYMLPSAYVVLAALPLTPNGKVDRRALPVPAVAEQAIAHTFVAPSRPNQVRLSQIWAEVLRLEPIGIHDNFFELGGHSLLATQVISRIRDTFAVDLSLLSLFDSPTIAELTTVIEACQAASDAITIQPISRDGGSHLPLSFAQRRLWFLDQLEGQSATYNLSQALQLSGPLDVRALEQAIATIIQRHEVLRTTFQMLEGEPVQVIAPASNFTLPMTDLQSVAAAEQMPTVVQIANIAAHQPFNLNRDQLIRCQLLKLDATSYVLLITLHHIISDGWSMGIFSRELSTLYHDYLHGLPASLPALPVQYADFAAAQRQWLHGQVLDRQLDYWRQQLAGAPALLKLPYDRPRPARQTSRGRTLEFELDAQLGRSLNHLSQRSGTTQFMTLLAAFSVLLSRYSDAEDMVIGSPIANRNCQEIEPLIGFFANTLLLRTQLDGNPPFSTLLQRVRQMTIAAYSHQDLPFEKLVEELNPERNLSYQPLFQVMFALQNATAETLELPDITISPLTLEKQTAKFDLTLSMWSSDQGLSGSWEYNCDLFDAETIQRMAAHFPVLLAGIVANPTQPIAELPLLSESERHQLLVEWNQTQTHYPKDLCVHQLFEAQVERTPNAIAGQYAAQCITYSDLNQRSNQLAHYLRAQGVGLGDRIGICLLPAIDRLVAIIGTLKAGGVYVPLNSSDPIDRLTLIIEDAQIRLCLTDSAPQFRPNIPQIDLGGSQAVLTQQPRHNPINPANANSAAYIIYTSGSTGKPKGVQVPHRAINRLVLNTNYIQLTSNNRIAQISNIAFDAATFEIWGALLNGATLIGLTPETVLHPQQFAQSLQAHKIDTLFLTTALFNQLSMLAPEAFPALRNVLFGGEAIDPQAVQRILAAGKPDALIHVYGPTENTTFSTYYTITAGTAADQTIPIGRPIANSTAYILDQRQAPVPVGITGELYVGGDGLALGYCDRPDLTAAQFVMVSLGQTPNQRLYKTGDLARYRPDGNIEFIGRRDQQVKIRGFRVEIGEVEAALLQLASVQAAVVITRKDATGNQQLLAYVVPQTNATLEPNHLKAQLQNQLPSFMLPATITVLAALPLTPNGKVDRRALPTPAATQTTVATPTTAPRNAVEHQLVQIWESCLGIQPIGIQDNFFDLGGHSLLAMKMLAEMERNNLSFPLNQLFQSPTIAAIAAALTAQSAPAEASCILQLKSGKTDAPLFLIHAGGSSVLFYQPLAQQLQTEQAVYAIQSAFLHHSNQEISSLEQLAQYYLQAIKSIQPHGPYFIGGASFGGIVAYEMAQQLLRETASIGALILLDRPAPSGLYRLPLKQRYRTYWHTLRKTGPTYLAAKLKHRLIYERQQFAAFANRRKLQRLKALGRPLGQELQGIDIYHRHVNLLNNYQLQMYPGDIHVIQADETADDVTIVAPDLGWSRYAHGKVTTWTNPGGHMSMFEMPHVQTLAARLDSILQSGTAP